MTSTSRRGSLSRRHRSRTDALQLEDNRLVLYGRASTTDQQHTLEAQAHDGKRFAEANGKILAASYIESGVSGSKPFLQRPEARKAIAHMKREGIGTLLVMKLDRAFRNVLDMRQTLDELLQQGITIRVANPDMDFKGPFGRLIATLLGAIAEFELGSRADRQSCGFESMRRQRIARSQNPPYGWTIGEALPQTSHSGKPQHRLDPVAEEQAVLREIIRRYEQRETLQAIADDLNSRGILTKRAGQTQTRRGVTTTITGTWKPQTVKSVLEHADLATPDPSDPPDPSDSSSDH